MYLTLKIDINTFTKELESISKNMPIMHWFNIEDKLILGFYNMHKLPLSLISNKDENFIEYTKGYKSQTKDVMWKIDQLFETIPDLKNKSILDLSCGTGIYSMELARRGCTDVTGIDINPIQIKQANLIVDSTNEFEQIRPKFECVNVSADSSSFLINKKYDVVLSFGLFYHLENPFRYLRNLKNLTNEYLFFQTNTHNNNETKNSLLYHAENPFKNVNGFSRFGLTPHFELVPKLLNMAGFKNVELKIPPYYKKEQEEMIRCATENHKYTSPKVTLWDKKFNGPNFFYYLCKI